MLATSMQRTKYILYIYFILTTSFSPLSQRYLTCTHQTYKTLYWHGEKATNMVDGIFEVEGGEIARLESFGKRECILFFFSIWLPVFSQRTKGCKSTIFTYAYANHA